MNDLATLTGQPRPLHIDGRTYRLYPLTFDDLGRFQAWLDRQVPDGDDAVLSQLGGLNADQQRYVVRHGLGKVERARPLFGSAASADLLFSVGGLTELLYLSIRRGLRSFRRGEAAALYWKLGDPGVRKVLWTIWGGAAGSSGEDDEEDDDPDPNDWWGLFHALMGEPHYFTPQQIGGMTYPQAVCALGDGKSPRKTNSLDSFQAYQDYMERRKSDPWCP